jgi:sulfur transfer protein SufE
MGNKIKKVLFHKKKQMSSKMDSLSDKENFYKMLLKFEKRHPSFDAKKMMIKLYPSVNSDKL